MLGLQEGFKAPVSMVDGGKYDADKAYKDSKLVCIPLLAAISIHIGCSVMS